MRKGLSDSYLQEQCFKKHNIRGGSSIQLLKMYSDKAKVIMQLLFLLEIVLYTIFI